MLFRNDREDSVAMRMDFHNTDGRLILLCFDLESWDFEFEILIIFYQIIIFKLFKISIFIILNIINLTFFYIIYKCIISGELKNY